MNRPLCFRGCVPVAVTVARWHRWLQATAHSDISKIGKRVITCHNVSRSPSLKTIHWPPTAFPLSLLIISDAPLTRSVVTQQSHNIHPDHPESTGTRWTETLLWARSYAHNITSRAHHALLSSCSSSCAHEISTLDVSWSACDVQLNVVNSPWLRLAAPVVWGDGPIPRSLPGPRPAHWHWLWSQWSLSWYCTRHPLPVSIQGES